MNVETMCFLIDACYLFGICFTIFCFCLDESQLEIDNLKYLLLMCAYANLANTIINEPHVDLYADILANPQLYSEMSLIPNYQFSTVNTDVNHTEVARAYVLSKLNPHLDFWDIYQNLIKGPYPRPDLIAHIKMLIEEINILKDYLYIKQEFIYEPITNQVIYPYTPEALELQKF